MNLIESEKVERLAYKLYKNGFSDDSTVNYYEALRRLNGWFSDEDIKPIASYLRMEGYSKDDKKNWYQAIKVLEIVDKKGYTIDVRNPSICSGCQVRWGIILDKKNSICPICLLELYK